MEQCPLPGHPGGGPRRAPAASGRPRRAPGRRPPAPHHPPTPGPPAEPRAADDLPPIIGESAAIQRVRALIDRAAPTDASVLIHGEPGSGKTLAARTVHARSARAAGPFVTVDGRSLSADAARPALRQAVADAAGGTLVLDEIATLPPVAQSELLAALEAGGDARLRSTGTGGRDALAAVRGDLPPRL